MSNKRSKWARWGRFIQGLLASAAAFVALLSFADLTWDWGIGVLGQILDDSNRGECISDMIVHIDEFCTFSPTEGEFRVSESGAIPPNEPRLVTDAVKIDRDDVNITFQAARIGSSWRIYAAGPWRGVDGKNVFCEIGNILQPGEFCIDPTTGRQFRVYATDEHNSGDLKLNQECTREGLDKCRPLHEQGYAVLYYFIGDENDRSTYTPNSSNGRLGDNSISCKDSSKNVFNAIRILDGESNSRTDVWKIMVATEGDESKFYCEDTSK